ncbi:MAG: hypothetical protein PHP75_06850, partial [Methylacidiphilaceae bacterium]|nr:hypothetical protein [Candidatus Methylacidiphilaceae bacterium]
MTGDSNLLGARQMMTRGCINQASGSHRLRERPNGRAETLTDYRVTGARPMNLGLAMRVGRQA